MALPLSPVPQGGFLMNALSNRNALMNQEYQNQIARAQAQYAPITTLSDAASKMAYANLMGPQFMAALMKNPDVLASLNNPKTAVNTLQQIAMGLTGVTNPLNQAFQNALAQTSTPQGNFFTQSPIGQLLGGIDNLFGIGSQKQQSQPQTSGNALVNNPQQIGSVASNPNVPANAGQQYDANGNNVVATPAEQAAAQQRATPKEDTPQNFATSAGEYQGIKKQGEELGKVRSDAIAAFDNQFKNDVNQEIPLKEIVNTLTSQDFQQLRNFPFYQDKQLNAYSKIGTPEQQQRIGNFLTSLETAVSQAVGGMQTGALDRMVGMAQRMKISPNDTYSTALGKAQALVLYNQMDQQLVRRASYYINNDKMNPGDAYEKALKQVDVKGIKNHIENMINPPVTDAQLQENAQHYGITLDEAKKKVKAKGLRLQSEIEGNK